MPSLASPALGTSRTVRRIRHRRTPVKNRTLLRILPRLRFSCSIFPPLELQRPLLPEFQQHQTDEFRQNIGLLQIMLYF